jgi:hypothetical protein
MNRRSRHKLLVANMLLGYQKDVMDVKLVAHYIESHNR